MNAKVLTVDDMLDSLCLLQEQADELVSMYVDMPFTMERYELMKDICENSWHQAQLRAWIVLKTEQRRSNILYVESDLV